MGGIDGEVQRDVGGSRFHRVMVSSLCRVCCFCVGCVAPWVRRACWVLGGAGGEMRRYPTWHDIFTVIAQQDQSHGHT